MGTKLEFDLSGPLPGKLRIRLAPTAGFYCRLTAITPQVFPDGSEVFLMLGDPRELDVLDLVQWDAVVSPTHAQFDVSALEVQAVLDNDDIVQGDSFYAMLRYRHVAENADLVWAHTSSGEVDW